MIGTTHVVKIESEDDIVKARRIGRNLAREIGFGSVDQIRIATGISELTRNVVRYAGAGILTVTIVEAGGRTGIEIICEDNGPGIRNVDEILQGQFTSGRGLGLGLAGTKRLMDEFQIITQVGAGTTVLTRKWL